MALSIPTLISTTSGYATNHAITSNIDSTYDHYMFVITNLALTSDGGTLQWGVNVAGESGFNEAGTSTAFSATQEEDGDDAAFAYISGMNHSGYAPLCVGCGDAADEAGAGILHLFNPANTTYVKHWYGDFNFYRSDNHSTHMLCAGYWNVTGAIDEVQFDSSHGNINQITIQMYGVA